jgi:hypothetical protein
LLAIAIWICACTELCCAARTLWTAGSSMEQRSDELNCDLMGAQMHPETYRQALRQNSIPWQFGPILPIPQDLKSQI